MAKQKFYVVWTGRKTGVFETWAECKAQTDGYSGAKYKSFESKALAEQAFRAGAEGNSVSSETKFEEIDYNSISVDVGTHGNPGPTEYKGVDTKTGEVIFAVGPISKGTNNLGEFLAIVHALAHLQKLGSNKTVYSDSVNAMKWVRDKKVATTLPRDSSTEEIWTLIDRAEHWLQNNKYSNKVLKWETKKWGEIKADYGRK